MEYTGEKTIPFGCYGTTADKTIVGYQSMIKWSNPYEMHTVEWAAVNAAGNPVSYQDETGQWHHVGRASAHFLSELPVLDSLFPGWREHLGERIRLTPDEYELVGRLDSLFGAARAAENERRNAQQSATPDTEVICCDECGCPIPAWKIPQPDYFGRYYCGC